MAKLKTSEITILAKQRIAASPSGVRYSVLVKEIAAANHETPVNTIHGTVWDLHTRFPDEISKPAKGLFVWVGPTTGSTDKTSKKPVKPVSEPAKIPAEDLFYDTFAAYLRNDLDEATEAEPLGGSIFRTKWGTPDVVGVYKPRKSDLVKFAVEIVSVEIKSDASQPIVAFGQAIAYRLFSSKVYIAMPTTLTQDDRDRLESLSLLFGVGLVFFDLDPAAPNYDVRVRAQRHTPDMYYVNQFAHALNKADAGLFEKLF